MFWWESFENYKYIFDDVMKVQNLVLFVDRSVHH